jgi:hypothetical protein
MRIFLSLLILVMLTACDRKTISYPDQGHYGVNVLNTGTSTVYDPSAYSLHALLGKKSSLRVVMTNTTVPMSDALWFYSLGSDENLIVSVYDDVSGVQTFESVEGASEIDLSMSFGGTGSAKIELYENGAAEPTRTKNIIW